MNPAMIYAARQMLQTFGAQEVDVSREQLEATLCEIRTALHTGCFELKKIHIPGKPMAVYALMPIEKKGLT